MTFTGQPAHKRLYEKALADADVFVCCTHCRLGLHMAVMTNGQGLTFPGSAASGLAAAPAVLLAAVLLGSFVL